ncbi:MAG: DUF1275 domain-containing protein [Cyclobacteriaceae bacterium]|nr:DUF1275 domain-containing protein [Cyclobacteriaceae bacterium]MCH8514719.1 DUF1275 domain-containing protein [Cyclobacteriaceae bacterium]
MFRQRGRKRTYEHNLKIASLLSFVAGMVNVAAFLAVKELATNVTGHFAFFMEKALTLSFQSGLKYFLYIAAFLLGSFYASFIMEYQKESRFKSTYKAPVITESLLLMTIALIGHELIIYKPDLLVIILLFAMGLQNSLVTTISDAIVRTTHLTGLFTDLGIDLSKLFFTKEKAKLFASIKLRLTIVLFFFLGGILGGFSYGALQLRVLMIAAILLIIGLIYDNLSLMVRRKYQHARFKMKSR